MYPDIWEVLEDAGYEINTLTDKEWDDAQTAFEEECDEWMDQALEDNNETIVLEWVHKLKLKKAKVKE